VRLSAAYKLYTDYQYYISLKSVLGSFQCEAYQPTGSWLKDQTKNEAATNRRDMRGFRSSGLLRLVAGLLIPGVSRNVSLNTHLLDP
jgi:hypothetical protein